VHLSLVANQGGGLGIHTEEEFGPCIRVNGLLSPRVNIMKFCPIFYNVKVCSGLIRCL
jgi:hypothetical protein